jgi:hypothetical protein
MAGDAEFQGIGGFHSGIEAAPQNNTQHDK